MAKKKTKKTVKKETNNYSIELLGILLIIIAIIGIIPNTGIVGNFISNFSAFLVGTWYNVLLILVMVIGIHMIIKREKPDFFTSKLIGFYIFIIGILILSHIPYIEDGKFEGIKIINETINKFMTSASNRSNLGGGIIGSCFSCLFVYLFEMNGTKIVTWSLIVCGLIMFTGISIYDALFKVKGKIKYEKKLKPKDKTKIEKIETQ